MLSSIAGCFAQVECGAVPGSGSQVPFCSYLLYLLSVFLTQVSKTFSLWSPHFNNCLQFQSTICLSNLNFICCLFFFPFLSLRLFFAHCLSFLSEFYVDGITLIIVLFSNEYISLIIIAFLLALFIYLACVEWWDSYISDIKNVLAVLLLLNKYTLLSFSLFKFLHTYL